MAEQDEDSTHTRRSKTLIVRHLPADLSREEKEDLLEYFGASSVRVLSDKGSLVRLHHHTSSHDATHHFLHLMIVFLIPAFVETHRFCYILQRELSLEGKSTSETYRLFFIQDNMNQI